jgi:hypothetical protein
MVEDRGEREGLVARAAERREAKGKKSKERAKGKGAGS